MYMWRILNAAVDEKGAFQSINRFRHGSQVLYNKNFVGVDGALQSKAMLRGPCTHQGWTGKVVTQGMKSLIVNEFILFIILDYHRNLSHDSGTVWFPSWDKFRHQLNNQQYFGDSMLYLCKKLLVCAAEASKRPNGGAAVADISYTQG